MFHVHEFKQGSYLPSQLWALLLQVLYETLYREGDELSSLHEGE